MGLEMVSRVRRYQGQCRALRPLGHQGYRLRSYKKDPPLHSGYTSLWMRKTRHVNRQLLQSLSFQFNPTCCISFSLGIDFPYSSL